MRALMIFCLIALTGTTVLGQSDIDRLLDRNIFDPDRGKKPEEEAEGPEEIIEEVIAKDMPVLDGTLIIGDTKIALFTYINEGQPTSARVSVDERVAGYTVREITRDGVKLQGGGEPVTLALFSGQKDKRGGTAAMAGAASRATPGSERPVNAAQLGRPNQRVDKDGNPLPNTANTRELPNARPNNQQNNPRFNRRTPPVRNQERRQKDASSNQLGKKF